MKDNFIDKLTEFDFLIDNKEKKLEDLNNNILEKENTINELEKSAENNSYQNTTDSEDVVLPKYADFEDGNLLSGYKVIKENFNFDVKKIINDFIKNNIKDNDTNFELYKKIKSYFLYDVIYRIATYSPEEQSIIVSELLQEDERECIKDLLDTKRFNINKFIDKLDNLIMKTDPEIKILVGDKNSNYDYIDTNIKTIYDENITEGFKIIYQGIVYDYSI